MDSTMDNETCKIQVMSDLHLETHPSYDDYYIPQSAPHLALLGDIGHVEKDTFFKFLERHLLRYRVVFFLLGNHEPFHLSMDFAKKRVKDFSARMGKRRLSSSTIGRFVFLDQTRFDLTDSLTILGCTLYSRVTVEQAAAVSSRFVDFRDILHWDVGEHVDAHLEDLKWLNSQVAELSAKEKKIIVFTHHSPSIDDRATNPKYRKSEVTSGFVTDLSRETRWTSESVVLWGFGHTHYNCDFVDDKGKRVVANQKGYYMFPRDTFKPNKVVELPFSNQP